MTTYRSMGVVPMEKRPAERVVSVRLPWELVLRLQALAAVEESSLGAIIRTAAERHVTEVTSRPGFRGELEAAKARKARVFAALEEPVRERPDGQKVPRRDVVDELAKVRERRLAGGKSAAGSAVSTNAATRVAALDVDVRPLAAGVDDADGPTTPSAPWVEVDLPEEFATGAQIQPVARLRMSVDNVVTVRVRPLSPQPPSLLIFVGGDASQASGPESSGDDWYEYVASAEAVPDDQFIQVAFAR